MSSRDTVMLFIFIWFTKEEEARAKNFTPLNSSSSSHLLLIVNLLLVCPGGRMHIHHERSNHATI